MSFSSRPQFTYVIEDITSCKQVEHQIREQAVLLDIVTDAIVVRAIFTVIFSVLMIISDSSHANYVINNTD